MRSISRASVPVYLRKSEFYLALSGEDDCEIEVPDDCFKTEPSVLDAQSLSHLLRTLRFWGVTEVLNEVYKASQDPKQYYDVVVDNFGAEFPYLAVLRDLRKVKALKDRLKFAICANSLDVYQFLANMYPRSIDPPLQKSMCVIAARCGHLNFLQYFHSLNYSWDKSACEGAAQFGHMSCLQYLHEHGCAWDAKKIAGNAVDGSAECLQYVADHGCVLDSRLYKFAARLDCAVRCEFLFKRGIMWDDSFAYDATVVNAVACLRFVLTHGCDYSSVRLGYMQCKMELLQLLAELKCLTPAQVAEQTTVAANGGELEKFAFLHSLNLRIIPPGRKKKLPPFDANTANDCLYYKADTKCFEYMVEHGFKITFLEVYYAHRRDNVLAVKYMHTQGFDLSTIRLDRERIQTTSAEMMQCLYEGEFQITEDTLVDAVVTNNLQVVKYLVELGCPVPSNVCHTAGTHHSFDVLVYLHEVKGYPLQCITRNEWNGQCDDYINQRVSALSRLANFFE